MLQLRRRRLWIALSVILLAAVFVVCLQPDVGPAVPAGFDKVEFRNLSGGIAAMHSGWKL